MSIRKTMLAAALAALAFAALPAVASADSIDYTNETGDFNVESGITIEEKEGETEEEKAEREKAEAESKITTLETEGGTKVTCTSSSGSGSFENSTAGSIKLHFNGCKSSGTNCTTAGRAAGEITTTTLQFDVVRLKGDGTGILITPNTITEGEKHYNHFASFKCAFGLVSVSVGGNGILGQITEPGYNEASSTFVVDFVGSEGEQEFTTIEGSEEEYGLESSINGGEYEPSTQDGIGTGGWDAEGTGTITE